MKILKAKFSASFIPFPLLEHQRILPSISSFRIMLPEHINKEFNTSQNNMVLQYFHNEVVIFSDARFKLPLRCFLYLYFFVMSFCKFGYFFYYFSLFPCLYDEDVDIALL